VRVVRLEAARLHEARVVDAVVDDDRVRLELEQAQLEVDQALGRRVAGHAAVEDLVAAAGPAVRARRGERREQRAEARRVGLVGREPRAVGRRAAQAQDAHDARRLVPLDLGPAQAVLVAVGRARHVPQRVAHVGVRDVETALGVRQVERGLGVDAA
jgi:hypothetical protein